MLPFVSELESHLDLHREGQPMTVKRGRGRPKGSKTKKADETVHQNSVEDSGEATEQDLRCVCKLLLS